MLIFILICLLCGFVFGVIMIVNDLYFKSRTFCFEAGFFVSSICLFFLLFLTTSFPYKTEEIKIDDFIMVKTEQYIYFIKDKNVKISTELMFSNKEKEHIDLYEVKIYNIFNKHLKTKLNVRLKGDDNG